MRQSIMGRYEKRWQVVRQRIADALAATARAPDSVRLLAVSKTFPAEAVRAVHALGQRAFGENYVQEAVAKQAALADVPGIEWHLIGPLQSNKAAAAARCFDWVESVDRVRIANALSAARAGAATPLDVLVQVNISGEEQKGGCDPDATPDLVRHVAASGLTVVGLMGIGPIGDPEAARSGFRLLRSLADDLALPVRSMGMSADLEAAIAEGATEVRVGSAIFGARAAKA